MKPFRLKGENAVRRMLSPEESDYRSVFLEHYNRLLAYGSTITDRRPIVEDQVQEVFIWLYQHPERCREIHQLEIYLYAALKKRILSALRKEQRMEARNDRYGDQKQRRGEEVPSEDGRWLAGEMKKLPPRMREVIYLRYYRCLDYTEISDVMNVNVQVARNFACRALRKLRTSTVQPQRKILPLLAGLLAFA